jgi:hypothetical protein
MAHSHARLSLSLAIGVGMARFVKRADSVAQLVWRTLRISEGHGHRLVTQKLLDAIQRNTAIP